MGKVTGFLEFERDDRDYRRSRSASSIGTNSSCRCRRRRSREQAARCMDCGVPYCHGTNTHHRRADRLPGQQPDPGLERSRLSRQLGRGRAQPALDQQFPGSHRPRLPGAVRGVLHAQHRRQSGHHQDHRMRDRRPRHRARLGQAGAAARARPARRSRSSARARPAWPARSSSRAPATTCMSTRSCAKAGGLLRYGIPDFKMEKIHRRPPRRADGGRRRDLPLRRPCRRQPAGREAAQGLRRGGARPAAPRSRATCRSRAASSTASISPWISCRSRTGASAASRSATVEPILATGKHVVVIGGGDTGSDCIGTSIRQGALSVTNFEIMPQPPEHENKLLTWPDWPLKLRTSSSHEEGAERDFAVLTHEILRRERPGEEAALRARRRQVQADPRHRVRDRGRSGAARHGLRASGARGHDQVARRRARSARQRQGRHRSPITTSLPKVFAAGDMRRGQSLVVWAIREGRQCAHAIDKFLMGSTTLPR